MSVALEVGVTQVEAARDRLLDLLPVHHRARDLGPAGAPGPLTELVDAIAGELALLEQDLDELYDGWFVETCAEWLVPYLADLVGLRRGPARPRRGRQPPGAGRQHRRLPPAQGHRRRARAGRPRRHGLADAGRRVPPAARRHGARQPRAPRPRGHRRRARRRDGGARRGAEPAGRAGRAGSAATHRRGAPDRLAARALRDPQRGHPAVPRPDLRGRPWSPPARGGGRGRRGVHFDPLGRSVPLFAAPRAEEAIERLATEPDLPLPLRPRRLLALLLAARARRARRGRAAARRPPRDRWERAGRRTASASAAWRSLAPGDEPQVMVDPVAGRLRTYREQAPFEPDDVFVRYAYGAMADVGAGTYDRSDVHDSVLADRPVDPAGRRRGPGRGRSRSRCRRRLAAALDAGAGRLGRPREARRPRHGDGLDRRQRALPGEPLDRGPGRDTARARRGGMADADPARRRGAGAGRRSLRPRRAAPARPGAP